jgi:hypothetical protein
MKRDLDELDLRVEYIGLKSGLTMMRRDDIFGKRINFKLDKVQRHKRVLLTYIVSESTPMAIKSWQFSRLYVQELENH